MWPHCQLAGSTRFAGFAASFINTQSLDWWTLCDMSTPSGKMFTARPALVHPNGERSLLIELHACPTPPTYVEAFRMDIKRGVDADITPALEEEARPRPLAQSASASTGIQGRNLPQSLAAGGSLGNAGSTTLESPLARMNVRSQSVPPVAATAPMGSRKPRIADARAAPTPRLFQRERTLKAEPVGTQPADKTLSRPFVGYCIRVEILCPDNLFEHERGDVTWEGNYVIVADQEGLALRFLLLLDTGTTIDSWVFCNLTWDSLDLFKGHPPVPLTPYHETQYYKKNRIHAPPQEHINDEYNTGQILYGLKGVRQTPLSIAQTLVKFQFRTRDRRNVVVLPEFPIGAVYGVAAEDLERGEEGLIALGRQSNARSMFESPAADGTGGVRWPSQTLASILQQYDNITEESFTIFIDHPLFVANPYDCIIFGRIYNPVRPRIPHTPEAWTSVPALSGTGLWKVYLVELEFINGGGNRSRKFPVGEYVIVDNGASQSYLPSSASTSIDKFLDNRGGSLPIFGAGDTINVVFATDDTPGQELISVTGQAKRFFTSPYLRADGSQARCVTASNTSFILGLNFFMTFIVSFEECRDPDARVLLHPHDFVE